MVEEESRNAADNRPCRNRDYHLREVLRYRLDDKRRGLPEQGGLFSCMGG